MFMLHSCLCPDARGRQRGLYAARRLSPFATRTRKAVNHCMSIATRQPSETTYVGNPTDVSIHAGASA